MIRKSLTLLLLAVFPLQGGAADITDTSETLRIAVAVGGNHHFVQVARQFQSELSQRAPHIRTEVLTDVANPNTITLNKQGCTRFFREAEVIINGNHPLAYHAPKFRFLITPFLMRDFDHLVRVWNSDVGKRFSDHLEKEAGMLPLAPLYQPAVHLSANKAVSGPADVVGMNLNVINAGEWTDVWMALKARIWLRNLSVVYPALQSGEFDGAELTIPVMKSLKFNEVQKYVVLTSHLSPVDMTTINSCYFREKLSVEDQAHVRSAMQAAVDWGREKWRAVEDAALADLKAKGMIVLVPDREALRRAAEPDLRKRFSQVWTVATYDEVVAQ